MIGQRLIGETNVYDNTDPLHQPWLQRHTEGSYLDYAAPLLPAPAHSAAEVVQVDLDVGRPAARPGRSRRLP